MSGKSDPPEKTLKAPACPICKAKASEAYRPFCSKRCADVDLHRWLTGCYAIPAVEADDDPEADGENE